MPDRLRRAWPAVIGLTIFIAALYVLRQELESVTWRELSRDVEAVPVSRLAQALLLTVLNYLVLTAYDFLALAYVGKRLGTARVAFTSFVAYAIANNVGFAMLSGASVRYRFYSRWGVTAEDLSRIVVSYAITFWLGLLFLGGISLAATRWPADIPLPHGPVAPAIGWALVLAATTYVALTFVRRAPVTIRGIVFPIPPTRIALAQLGVSVLDWMLAAGVLHALLPESRLSFLGLLGVFTLAQLAALASHVPGGIGVFESLMVIFLKPFHPSAVVLPALVVYRAVYYLLPLTLALLALVVDELAQRRSQTARMGALVGRVTEWLMPRLLAVFTFLSGMILLFSGATPAAAGRLTLLDRVFPLGVVEASHFIGSIVGAALLVLSQGLARRLDAAYVLASSAIALGIAVSLLKGADYEEAVALSLVLALLWRARSAFDRRASFFETKFSPAWLVAVTGAMVASVWLGLFAFKHVEYSNQLWWQFELHGEASRFLRGSIGAAVFLLIVALARLIRTAPHKIATASDDDLAAAARVIAGQTSTLPYLLFLGDKAIQFDEGRQGFLMYGIHGRTWAALGDPVAPVDRVPHLIRGFLERTDDFDGIPVFYEVGKTHLHHYADFGMTFLKLGEEAIVDVQAFSLDGGRARKYRQALRQLEKQGATFRVVGSDDVISMLGPLREVSDEWLASKASAEKGFSLGFFHPEYLARFPVAVVERGREVLAFANLWPGPGRVELSVDLMRYRRDAPDDVMEALLLHVLQWAKAEGYRSFSLGMAPLSGFERSPIAPLWNQLGSFVYAHGEAFYKFQGLRAYKEKFHPEWEPRYLVYAGGFGLPRALADIAALIAGGYRKIFLK